MSHLELSTLFSTEKSDAYRLIFRSDDNGRVYSCGVTKFDDPIGQLEMLRLACVRLIDLIKKQENSMPCYSPTFDEYEFSKVCRELNMKFRDTTPELVCSVVKNMGTKTILGNETILKWYCKHLAYDYSHGDQESKAAAITEAERLGLTIKPIEYKFIKGE